MNDKLTIAEAAELKGVTRGRVYQWIWAGRLVVEHHGAQCTLVNRDDVLALEPRPAGRPRKSA